MDNEILEIVEVYEDGNEPRVYYIGDNDKHYMAFWGELFHKNSIF